ncbi:MAG: hypothetical protein ABI323_02880 [Solirubrobacteraceae bacterium]
MATTTRRIAMLAVTGLVALAGVAIAAPSGTYSGTTSQKLGGKPDSISLTVSHGSLTRAVFVARLPHGPASCANSQGGTFTMNRGRLKINKHGKFSGKLTFHGGLPESATFTGRFKGTSVSGSLNARLESDSIHGAHTCTSGKVTFRAKRS